MSPLAFLNSCFLSQYWDLESLIDPWIYDLRIGVAPPWCLHKIRAQRKARLEREKATSAR
jgi:hypothetical protein